MIRAVELLIRGAAVVAGMVVLAANASAANFFEKNIYLTGPRYDAVVPLCEDGWVLGRIQSRFAAKESRYWQSALQIAGFERVREIAFRPWRENAIPRRYCSAVALVTDGKKRPIYFSVIEDGGMIGFSWGVEWCVVGLDRNWAYNPACRAARP